ncbi:Phosphoserine phosphatase chloroplastic [Melia azedarach]|uniref:Phosphoserine phosphatase chloroplastic n=1 Tax=Melia azedarach TaxID=155640 RepID=A0ACC1XNX3_MELAZ|nr:Phosphoserine phosphatase chloroplastic [Melia azedarach]
MEGLVSSQIITPEVKFGLLKHPKSFNPVAASVKPLEASTLGRFNNTSPSKEVLELWRNADAVCFDVDSTVCVDEGIDELAEFCGAGKAVAEWTARAMGGSVPFEEALAARLSLFKPSLSQVQDFLEKRPPSIIIKHFPLKPVASILGVEEKAKAVQQVRKAHGYKALVMIGDGATDLEAHQPGGADMFICYGGVQLRESVAEKADWLVFNFEDLMNSLD